MALIGANGAGKSTFARLLNGLILPDSGVVEILGLDSRKQTQALRRQVGFVFQNPDLQFVYSIVAEDLAFGLRNIGTPKSRLDNRIDDILDRFDLGHLRDRHVHTLSGGEKQLVCLAAVLVMQPALVVLDEPTTLLDLANTRQVNRILMALPEPIVVVTHDLEFAQQCEEVIWVHRNRIALHGDPGQVVQAYTEAMLGGDHDRQ